MSRELEAHGHDVISTDLIDRGYGMTGRDFYAERRLLAPNIVTNPPFKRVDKRIAHCMRLQPDKFALLLKVTCLAGARRRALYDLWRPARVLVFSSRITMWRNGIVSSDAGGVADFMWVVWDTSQRARTLTDWINPTPARAS